MQEILNKISSYNLFNYLFPGVVFAAIATEISSFKFIQNDIIIGFFVYYLLGLIISRIGSLLIEPTLKKIEFLKFGKYSEFVKASELDPKIEILSEANNMYRTLSAMCALLAIIKFYDWLEKYLTCLLPYRNLTLLLALTALFLMSYRKQTAFINKRIKMRIKENDTKIS